MSTTIVPAITTFSSGIYNYRHVALTISGNTHTLYLDGSAVAVNLSGGDMLSYNSAIPNVYIGCAGDLSYGFTGIIDDFKIWNRALPSSDISAIYFANIPYYPPINLISSAAYNSMINTGTTYNSTDNKYDGTRLQAGAYGLKLLVSKWKDKPVIQLTKDGNTTQDFYAPNDGTTNLTTLPNGAGTGIVAWLNSARGYVTKWYDQTGNSHDATAAACTVVLSTSLTEITGPTAYLNYPFIDTTDYVVDFSNNGYFYLPNNSYPINNTPYTFLFKHAKRLTNNCCVMFTGVVDSSTKDLCIVMPLSGGSLYYNNAWNTLNASILTQPVTQSVSAIVAITYNGTYSNSGRKNYINNSLRNIVDTLGTDTRNNTGGNCLLGSYGNNTYYTFNSAMAYFYWMPYQLNLPEITILGKT